MLPSVFRWINQESLLIVPPATNENPVEYHNNMLIEEVFTSEKPDLAFKSLFQEGRRKVVEQSCSLLASETFCKLVDLPLVGVFFCVLLTRFSFVDKQSHGLHRVSESGLPVRMVAPSADRSKLVQWLHGFQITIPRKERGSRFLADLLKRLCLLLRHSRFVGRVRYPVDSPFAMSIWRHSTLIPYSAENGLGIVLSSHFTHAFGLTEHRAGNINSHVQADQRNLRLSDTQKYIRMNLEDLSFFCRYVLKTVRFSYRFGTKSNRLLRARDIPPHLPFCGPEFVLGTFAIASSPCPPYTPPLFSSWKHVPSPF
jgi:hypothetical protein